MKLNVQKSTVIIIACMAVPTFIYPLLHEVGHVFFALIFRCNIQYIKLFPVPQTAITGNGTPLSLFFIGIGGLLFPVTVSFLFRPKRTLLKIISAVLIAVESFSMAIAIVSVFLFAAETPMPNDDITLLMEQNEYFGLLILIISLIGFFSLTAVFVQKRPLALIKLYLRNP